MADASFFERPILNSPYEYPRQHWELDKDGQPTNVILAHRRRSTYVTPIPKAKKRKKKKGEQQELEIGGEASVSTARQKYDPTPIINELRGRVDAWRELKNPGDWGVTPDTARLLQHWRQYQFTSVRPFFCQVEAVETLIWLTEVAPHDKNGARFLDHLKASNADANPGLSRLALKLATGAGKASRAHASWWEQRIARQKEIDASIAAKAETEYLYDKPYEDKSKVRVAGPFTVESLSPHRVLGVDEDDELLDSVVDAAPLHADDKDFAAVVLENLRSSGVQQAHKEDRITFTSLAAWPGEYIAAEGRYSEGSGAEKRAGIFIGPEFGTDSKPDLVAAAREAGDARFDVLIACAFSRWAK